MYNQLLKRGKLKCKNLVYGNLFPYTRNYQKFILLSRGRTGSNFLLTILNNHPEVACYFEPFRRKRRPTVDPFVESLGKKYMDQYIFKAFPKNIEAVGMKIFYTHARYIKLDPHGHGSSGYGPIWDYLIDDPNLKVIQLYRKNLLRVYLSEQLARQTNSWYKVEKNESVENFDPIELDFDYCKTTFEHITQREKDFDKLFSNHPKFDITYSQIVNDRDKVLQEIQHFLGLTTLYLPTFTTKQNNHTLRECIANYEELKEKFTGTEWEKFFEE